VKQLASLGGLAVVLFWLFMNGLLVRRELHYQGLDQYRRGVIDFLGGQPRRERWMGIYRKSQRLGHTGFAIERGAGSEGGFRMEFSTKAGVDLFGAGGQFALEGTLLLDVEMAPRLLRAAVSLGTTALQLQGRREADRFLLTISEGGRRVLEQRLPLNELLFGDGMAPLPPVAGLRVGDSITVPVFDPIFRESSQAETRVVAAARRDADGVAVDCLELETRFRGMTFRSWVTRDGEVLRQEVPPPLNVVLVREPAPVREKRR
jgi:hypothetical protein